jgi:hypothetical protein
MTPHSTAQHSTRPCSRQPGHPTSNLPEPQHLLAWADSDYACACRLAVQVVRVPRPSSSEVQVEAERWQKRLHQQFGQRLAAAGVEHELHVLVHPAAGEGHRGATCWCAAGLLGAQGAGHVCSRGVGCTPARGVPARGVLAAGR